MGGPDKSGLTFATTYVLSATSACIAETVTFPLDIIKTRLQVQTAADATKRGIFQTAAGIVKEEGVLGLYGGLGPACLRHVVYSGSRVMVYEALRENVFKRNEDGSFPLWKGLLAGMSAGAIGQFIANPTDLVKVQMQTDGKRVAQGLAPKHTGTMHAFRSLYSQAGLAGMWRGWAPSCQRAALVQIGDLTSYDYFKQTILSWGFEDGPTCHAMASAGAGLVAATLGTPADVIKTRVMNQPLDAHGKGTLHSSTFDCLKKTIAQDGVLSLYKGFIPGWLRMAPWSLCFFLSFEQLRKALGLSSF